MKIAVGTDDRKTIRKGHFGDSRYYLVLEILNVTVVAREWRDNPLNNDEKEKKHHGWHQEIIKLLRDCALFVGKGFGKKSLEEITSRGIDCIISDIDNIERAISSYLDGQDTGFAYYDRRAKAFIPCVQRTFKKQG